MAPLQPDVAVSAEPGVTGNVPTTEDPGPPEPPESLLAAPPPPPPVPPTSVAMTLETKAGTVVVAETPQACGSVQDDRWVSTWVPNENWSAGTGVLTPDGVTTVTSTVPLPAGDVAVIEFELSAVIVPGVDPKSTAVAPERLVPEMVTCVPPAAGPVTGLMAVTVGGGTTTV